MKRTLLAATALIGLSVTLPARADVPVIDAAAILKEAMEASDALNQQIKQWETMKQQLMGIQQTVSALSNPRQILQDAPGLLNEAQQLPGSASSAMRALGFGSSTSSASQPFYGQNHYYTPQDTSDFAAQEIQRRAQVTANIQGEVQTGLDTASQRISLLSELQSAVEGKPDQMAVSAAQAHIASEGTFLANEQANVQRLQVMLQSADRVDQERAMEAARKDAEDWQSDAAALAGN